MTEAQYKQAVEKDKKTRLKPLTKEEREKYKVEERAEKISKRHNIPKEDAEEVVTEVVRTKEMPGDDKKKAPRSKAAAKRAQKEEDALNAQHVALEEAAPKKKAELDAEPAPVPKGVKGPLGALLNGQRFFVPGAVGDFILQGWALAPGVFDDKGELRRCPKVSQITQRRTATKKEVLLKPALMTGWFEETIVEVIEDFALLTGQVTLNSDEEATMPNKKSAAKKAANGKAKGAGRGPKFGDDAVVKLTKGVQEDDNKRYQTILGSLKELGGKATVAALAKAFGKASGTKQDAVKVLRMWTSKLIHDGRISITPA